MAAAAKKRPRNTATIVHGTEAQAESLDLTAAELIDSLRGLHLSPADLKALIELTHDFIGEDLERRLDALKASRDGRFLPREVLRREITRNHVCMCRSALHHCEQN